MIYLFHIITMLLTFIFVVIAFFVHPFFAGMVAMAIVGLHWIAIAGYKDKIKRLEKEGK